MKIQVKRRYFAPTYTIGTMYIDGERFCDTLEDKNRDTNHNGQFDGDEVKVKHETAIPFGTYKVIIAKSPRFDRDLPRLLDVPNFDGVLIHRGNAPEDTSGCILVGEKKAKSSIPRPTS